jgi:hypothetical protein
MKRLLGLAAMVTVAVAASAQYSGLMSDIPAFNAAPPRGSQPPILSGAQLRGPDFVMPYQAVAYQMAAKAGPVMFQQPCYCRCDRIMGHNSLRSCFTDTHGAECSTCMKEAAYTYDAWKHGKSAAQIRAGIERGEWMNLDLEKIHL